jgi:recombinational DNA repair ATPase RecF
MSYGVDVRITSGFNAFKFGRENMSDQELHLLEEKVDGLLRYCERLGSERNDLLRQTQEQATLLKELEGKLARFEEERENVRLRVSDLLGKIDQIDAFSKEFEDTATAPQTVTPLGV